MDLVLLDVVRRLFSTFADGLPGAGLLMLRFFLCGALTLSAIGAALHGSSMTAAIANVLAAVAGIFLLLGLWTPVVCMAVAVTELWIVFSFPADLRLHLLQAAFAVGLAMIGPGVWSLDARLYGWRRVEIPSRKG